MLEFSTINHLARKSLGISWMEYGFADMVYNLSNNPSSPFPGWCFMSRPTMAQEMGVSKRTILNYIEKLEGLGLIEKSPRTSYLKTTSKWYNASVSKRGEKSSPGGKKVASEGVKKIHPEGEKSSPYKDINKNSKNTTLSLSENSKKIERTESGAIDAKQFTKTVTAEQEPKEAPPVAPPPPFDIEQEIKSKVSGQQQLERLSTKYKLTIEQVKQQIDPWIDHLIQKECGGMQDSEIESWAKRSSRIYLEKAFGKQYLSNYHKFDKASNTTTTNRSNGKSNSYEKPRRKSRSEVEWESLRSFPDFAHLPKWTPDFYDVSPYTYGQTQGENVGSESGTEAAGHTIVVDGDNVYGYAN